MNNSPKVRKKIMLSILTTLVVLIFSYKLAFQKTINCYIEYRRNLHDELESESATSRNINLKKEIEQINTFYLNNKNEDVRNLLMEELSQLCEKHNIRLKELLVPLESKENDILVQSNIIYLNGSFQNLLKVISDLEKAELPGKIVAVSFSVVQNTSNGNKELISEVIFQNIKDMSSEKEK